MALDGQRHCWPLASQYDRFLAFDDLYEILSTKTPSEQRGIVAEIAGSLDGLGEEFDSHATLSIQELKRLEEGGLITIGGYTHNCVMLSPLPEWEQVREIGRNKQILEEILGHRIEYFAYPFGRVFSTEQHGEAIMPIRILVVDHYGLLRMAIGLCLAKEPDMEVVGEAEDGRVAVRLARELNPDVIIMDVAMPNLNGVEATRQIVREQSNMKIIAFSAASDRRSVQEMLEAGASGYVPKSCSFDELHTAIRNVASNHAYLIRIRKNSCAPVKIG